MKVLIYALSVETYSEKEATSSETTTLKKKNQKNNNTAKFIHVYTFI